ncbi:hypothetical protein [Gemmata palustris]|uniref:hypothetical protein n=1 Tax=Gemmata palustris TaxID=2822762 RepID=UPI001FEC0180|nr:hypothetical protein [Gemmata palustris]
MAKKRKPRVSAQLIGDQQQTIRCWFAEADWMRCIGARDFYSIQLSFQSLILDGCPIVTDRKIFLYDIACARHVLPLRDNELLRRTVELATEAAEGTEWLKTRFLSTSGSIREALREYGPPPECLPRPPLDDLTRAALELASALAHQENPGARVRWMGGAAAEVASVASGDPGSNPIADTQITFLRDVFENVVWLASIKRTWSTSTVLALAKQMYDSRDFSVMPILADALQDAGCDNVNILNHCRDADQIHVRGCWVVDLLLGKK